MSKNDAQLCRRFGDARIQTRRSRWADPYGEQHAKRVKSAKSACDVNRSVAVDRSLLQVGTTRRQQRKTLGSSFLCSDVGSGRSVFWIRPVQRDIRVLGQDLCEPTFFAAERRHVNVLLRLEATHFVVPARPVEFLAFRTAIDHCQTG